MLSGLKTYIVAAITFVLAIAGFLMGELTILQAFEAAGLAIGLSGNRFVVAATEFLAKSGIGNLLAPPDLRQWVTRFGTALVLLTATLAQLTGDQTLVVTIGAILGALGFEFLGAGAQKSAEAISSG